MSDIAVVYATISGNTKAKAEYIANALGADIYNLKEVGIPDLSKYSKVVCGTGIHAGNLYLPFTKLFADPVALKGKKLYVFLLGDFMDRAESQRYKFATQLNVPDTVFFNKNMTAEVDAFIEKIKQ